MNVPEQEGENCANFIYDIIENGLNMDVENLQFHAIHRVGKRRSSDETSKAYPRPIKLSKYYIINYSDLSLTVILTGTTMSTILLARQRADFFF